MTPDPRRQHGQYQAEQHRDAEAVDDARDDIASLVIEAEPVAIADGVEARQLIGRRVAQRRARGPWWRCRIAEAQVVAAFAPRVVLVDGVVGVADRRPDGPAVGLDLVEDHRVLVVGDGEEAAELRFGIVGEHRRQQLALVAHQQRAIVGKELGEQRDEEQREEDAQAQIAAPVRLEICEAPLVDRTAACRCSVSGASANLARSRDAPRPVAAATAAAASRGRADQSTAQTSRLSKSMRGSTRV